MGTLFPDSDEFPDYVPFPSFPVLVIEAARAGVLPLVVAAVLFAASERSISPESERFVPPAMPFEAEGPHMHLDEYVPMPPASEAAIGPSTSGDKPVPFVPSNDGSQDVIRRHWEARQAAHYRAMTSHADHIRRGVVVCGDAGGAAAHRSDQQLGRGAEPHDFQQRRRTAASESRYRYQIPNVQPAR